jgi:hypothetical protein
MIIKRQVVKSFNTSMIDSMWMSLEILEDIDIYILKMSATGCIVMGCINNAKIKNVFGLK